MDEFYSSVIGWFLRLNLWKRLIVLGGLLLIALALARIGALGDPMRDFSRRVFNGTIPVLDEEKPYLDLHLVMKTTHCGDGVLKIRNNGVTVSTQDRFKVTVNTSADAYISVIGKDKKGYYGLFPEIISAEKFTEIKTISASKDINYHIDFEHDEIEGEEAIFLLASQKEFDRLSPSRVLDEVEQTASKGPSSASASLHVGDIKIKKFWFNVSDGKKSCT